MIFVDTNYFLRFLLKDNPEHYQQAHQLFFKAARGEIKLITNLVVFFEIVWVLRKNVVKNRQSLAEILMKTLSLNIEFEQRDLLLKTVDLFKNSTLSLEDCYHLVFAQSENAQEFKTFDKRLKKHFKPLPL